MSKRQIKVYHPDATEPVGISPDQLAHFESNGWSTKKITTSNEKVTPITEDQNNGNN